MEGDVRRSPDDAGPEMSGEIQAVGREAFY
jgi:hypothetical protein